MGTWHVAMMALATLVGCVEPRRSEPGDPSDPGPGVDEGTVTVKINVPNPGGIDVYFQDEQSVLLGHVVSDDTGVVIGPMRGNGFVSVFDAVHEADTHELYTFTSVQVGDELVVGTRVPRRWQLDTTIRFQRSAAVESVDLMAAGCDLVLSGSTTTPTTVDKRIVWTTCEPVIDLIAVALGPDGVATGWTLVKGVTLAGDIDLTGATFAPMVRQDVTLVNLPAETLGWTALTSDVVTTDGAYLRPRFEAPSVGTFHFDLAAVPAASNLVRMLGANRHNEWLTLYDRRDTLDPRTLDVGSYLLPAASCPTFEFETHEVTWLETPLYEGVMPDYAIAQITVIRKSGTDYTGWLWHLVGPHHVDPGLDGITVPSLRAPLLPPELEPFTPDPESRWGVTLERGAITGGYPALRTSGFLPYSSEAADWEVPPYSHASIAFAERVPGEVCPF